jgi:hypothetical protein
LAVSLASASTKAGAIAGIALALRRGVGLPVLGHDEVDVAHIDRSGSVSIVTQVHGTERSLTKRIGTMKRPERSLKRADDKPAADNRWWFLLFK